MELIVEVLLELLVEVLFAAVVGLFDGGLDGKSERTAQRALVMVLFGIGLGIASAFVLPEHFLSRRELRLAWLGVAPVLGGLVIAGFTVLRRWHEEDRWRWDKFVVGALFVGSLNATRFVLLG
jgi:uncharacterized membrane protein YbjE (DUF340 family)